MRLLRTILSWLIFGLILPGSTGFAQTNSIPSPLPSETTSPTKTLDSLPPPPEFHTKRSQVTVKSAFAPDKEIPNKPVQPPVMIRSIPENHFLCKRLVQQGKEEILCDSHVKADGESLGRLMADSPEALAEILAYQKTRASARWSAIAGTAGIATAIAGFIISGFMNTSYTNGNKTSTVISTAGILVRDLSFVIGMGTAIGGISIGLHILRENETRLSNAVGIYNEQHPDKPIQLMFSAGMSF